MNYLLDFYRTGQIDFYRNKMCFSQKRCEHFIKRFAEEEEEKKKKKLLKYFPDKIFSQLICIYVGHCVSLYSVMQVSKLFVKKGRLEKKF